MIRIRRYIPPFVEHDPQPLDGCVDTAAVLQLEWVRSWSDDPGFSRFSVSDERYLMAEMKDGKFWVVGIRDIRSDAMMGLPVWIPPQP